MMPGEARAAPAPATVTPAACLNCDSLRQSLNEYVTALIAMKQKIVDTDHILTEYQKKCDELQKTERECKTLRDQMDELLEKCTLVEQCKDEMKTMRIELEEKKSSIKMYQQNYSEYTDLKQEQAKHELLKKKLEARLKKLEETTTKQTADLKAVKKEKSSLEKALRKAQKKLIDQQDNGIKVSKRAKINEQVLHTIDKKKVKELLEEVWMCIGKPTAQDMSDKEDTYSLDKHRSSRKISKLPRNSLFNPSHSSPLEIAQLPKPLPSPHLKCDEEENRFHIEVDESMNEEGLKSNSDSAFYDDRTVELTIQKDSADCQYISDGTDDDDDDDAEQESLSQQLQEILDWTEPLPPQLSPLPCSPSAKQQALFGNMTDSSDDEAGNVSGGTYNGGDLDTGTAAEPLDLSVCVESPNPDQTLKMEVSILKSATEGSPAGKTDCSDTVTGDLSQSGLMETEAESKLVESELSVPCLPPGEIQCKNLQLEDAKNAETPVLFQGDVKQSNATAISETQRTDSVIAPDTTFKDQLSSTQHVHGNGDRIAHVGNPEISGDIKVSLISSYHSIELEHQCTEPYRKGENESEADVQVEEKCEFLMQESSASEPLNTASEAMEVEEVHFNTMPFNTQWVKASVKTFITNASHTESMAKNEGAKAPSQQIESLTSAFDPSELDKDISASVIGSEEVDSSSFASVCHENECSITPVCEMELNKIQFREKEKTEMVIPLPKSELSAVTDLVEDEVKECISREKNEIRDVNSNCDTPDSQKYSCGVTSVQSSTELIQAEYSTKQRSPPHEMESTASFLPESDHRVAVDATQDQFKVDVSTGEMEGVNPGSFTPHSQNGETSEGMLVESSDVKQIEPKFERKETEIEQIAPLLELNCSTQAGAVQSSDAEVAQEENSTRERKQLCKMKPAVAGSQINQIVSSGQLPTVPASYSSELSISAQDNFKNCLSNNEVEEVDSSSSVSGGQNAESTVASVQTSPTQICGEFTREEKDTANLMEIASLPASDCSVMAGLSQDKSMNYSSFEDLSKQGDKPVEFASTEDLSNTRAESVKFDSIENPANQKDTSVEFSSTEDLSNQRVKSMDHSVSEQLSHQSKQQDVLTMKSELREESNILTVGDNSKGMLVEMITVKEAVCENPVSELNEEKDQLKKNEKLCNFSDENSGTRDSEKQQSSKQKTTDCIRAYTFSDESEGPNVSLDSAEQEYFTEAGEKKAIDYRDNIVVYSKLNINPEKSIDLALQSREVPFNDKETLSLEPLDTETPQNCETIEDARSLEPEKPVLVLKVGCKKQQHSESVSPEQLTVDTTNVNSNEQHRTSSHREAGTEIEPTTENINCMSESHKADRGDSHFIGKCDELRFGSQSVPDFKEGIFNEEIVAASKEEFINIPLDRPIQDVEWRNMELTEASGNLLQIVCAVIELETDTDSREMLEADDDSTDAISVGCETPPIGSGNSKVNLHSIDTWAGSKLNSKTSSECNEAGKSNLSTHYNSHNELEDGIDTSAGSCSAIESGLSTKQHFKVQINEEDTATEEEMPGSILCDQTDNSTHANDTEKKSCSCISTIQKVDSSSQTELSISGMEHLLYINRDPSTIVLPALQQEVDEKGNGRCELATRSSQCSGLRNPTFFDDASDPGVSGEPLKNKVLFKSKSENSMAANIIETSDCESIPRKARKDKKLWLEQDLLLSSTDKTQSDHQAGSNAKKFKAGTVKRRVTSRVKSRSSDYESLLRETQTDASLSPPSLGNIHKVMLEMGQPLPPLLAPLVATPPRTTARIRPLIVASNVRSVHSLVDELSFTSAEHPKPCSVSPVFDRARQKSPSVHSPSPLDFARNERIQSSPLQFCTATPKHAVPVPGRLPQSASATVATGLPQENSVKILDAMYPNLSARARTLNILRGNVQLSMRGPTDGESQTGAVNQIVGFKAINSTATAFVKAGSNCRSECRKNVERTTDPDQEQLVVPSGTEKRDTPKEEKATAKRTAENLVGKMPKKIKLAQGIENADQPPPLVTSNESSAAAAAAADSTKPVHNELAEHKAGPEPFSPSPEQPVMSSEDAVACALAKLSQSCFDLLPVIRSHIFVGNIPSLPVLRDEEKQVISEFSENKELSEALLLAIQKKLKSERLTLDINYLHALCRVYTAICRQQGDLERARILCFDILREDFPDSDKLILFITSVWKNIFSMRGPLNKAMQVVARQRAKDDVLQCLTVYLDWQKNPPRDASQLISSFLVAMQISPTIKFQEHEELGTDFNGAMWELIFAIDLLCSQQPWCLTLDNVISKELWPLMDKWVKRRKGKAYVLHIQDVTIGAVLRLIGRLGKHGITQGYMNKVKHLSVVMNLFLQQSTKEGVPWSVQIAAAQAVYELSLCDLEDALKTLKDWKATATEAVPSSVSQYIAELETFYQGLNTRT